MTSHQINNLHDNGTDRGPYWCDLCAHDMQSSKNLLQHKRGKKHRERFARQYGHEEEKVLETEPPKKKGRRYCRLCKTAFRDLEAYKYHQDYDQEHLKNVYRSQGIEFDETILKEAYCLPVVDDLDYTNIEDTERMHQTDYDDAVVELALHNYESYHAMKPGSVTYAMVNGTSAGIIGWAACTIGHVNIKEEEEVVEPEIDDSKPPASSPVSNNNKPTHRKGDRQEEDSLRIATMESLLESRGVRPASDYDIKGDCDVSEGSYHYEDDDDSSQGDDLMTVPVDDERSRYVEVDDESCQYDAEEECENGSDGSWSHVPLDVSAIDRETSTGSEWSILSM